jgi:hypothetical protein
MRLLLTAFLTSIFLTTGYAGQSYRWVDEEGNVQYSQTPPKGVEEVRKVELAPPSQSSGADTTNEATKDTEKTDQAENPDQTTGDPTQKPANASEEMQAIKKQNCDNARGELTKLGTANAQLVVEDKDNPGKFVPLSEEERKQHADKAQAYLDAFCKE